MDLLTFANATITSLLPSTNEQGQFIIDTRAALSIDIAPDDLSTHFSTFEALLDNFSPLLTFVALYLKALASGGFSQGSIADFLGATIGAALPGGSTGSPWSNAVKMLASAIPAVCFTSTLHCALATTVADGTQQVSSACITRLSERRISAASETLNLMPVCPFCGGEVEIGCLLIIVGKIQQQTLRFYGLTGELAASLRKGGR